MTGFRYRAVLLEEAHEWVITKSHHYGIFTVHRWPFLTFAQHGIVKNPNEIAHAVRLRDLEVCPSFR